VLNAVNPANTLFSFSERRGPDTARLWELAELSEQAAVAPS
jgi:hypothetical protein